MEPLSRLLYGALQEMALAIGHSEDPDATRSELAAAAEWVLASLLRPSGAGEPPR